MRKIAWIFSIALLLVTGVLGLYNGSTELGDAATGGGLQRSVSLGVMLYGFLGLVGAFGLARRRPWTVTVATAWAIVITYVASVASFAYSDPDLSEAGTLVGVVAAGLSCVVIGAVVVWTARASTTVRPS